MEGMKLIGMDISELVTNVLIMIIIGIATGIVWGIICWWVKFQEKKYFEKPYSMVVNKLLKKIKRFSGLLLILVNTHLFLFTSDTEQEIVFMHVMVFFSYLLGIFVIAQSVVFLGYFKEDKPHKKWSAVANIGSADDILEYLFNKKSVEYKGFESIKEVNEKVKEKTKDDLILMQSYLGVKSRYSDIYLYGIKFLGALIMGVITVINVKTIYLFIEKVLFTGVFFLNIISTLTAMAVIIILVYDFYFAIETKRTTKTFLISIIKNALEEKDKIEKMEENKKV